MEKSNETWAWCSCPECNEMFAISKEELGNGNGWSGLCPCCESKYKE